MGTIRLLALKLRNCPDSPIIGINPTTGQIAFDPPMEQSEYSLSTNNPVCVYYANGTSFEPALVGTPIIAGDGYTYVPYEYYVSSDSFICTEEITASSSHIGVHSRVMRVGTDGSSQEELVGDWTSDSTTYEGPGCPTVVCSSSSGSVPNNYELGSPFGYLITNADQGVLYSWSVCFENSDLSCTPQYYLTTISSAGVSTVQVASVPGQATPVQPVMQRQDGDFIGTVSSSVASFMVAFTPLGQTLWTVPNDTPQIATSDNGVIGASGAIYDQNGNVDGQSSGLGGYNWLGNPITYASSGGSVIAQALLPLPTAYNSFIPAAEGNPSNPTAVQQCAPLSSSANQLATQAYSGLRDFLGAMGTNGKPKNCPACDALIFGKLKMKRVDFVQYLQQTPVFCDGTMTTNISATTITNDPKYADKTIAEYFKAEVPDAATEPNGPSSPLFVFFNPNPSGTYTITNPNVGGTYNEALVFHEGLHGYTRLWDSNLAPPGLCQILVPSEGDCPSRTIDITFFIEDLAWPVP